MSVTYLIAKVEPYVGEDTFLSCGLIGEDYESLEQPMFLIINLQTGKVVDYGYPSYEEAKEAWPDAVYTPPSEETVA